MSSAQQTKQTSQKQKRLLCRRRRRSLQPLATPLAPPWVVLPARRRSRPPPRSRALCSIACVDLKTFPCMFPQGTMPTVRSLHFSFLPRQIFSYGFELSMSHLPSIQQVTADIWCHGANAGEVKFAETEFRRAVADHPNLPTRLINRYGIDRCLEKQAL
ncbi:hypothetical protein BRADI_4g12809v3 [Brachypodium distachyon]|uniref:Disease resistance R13L4/SHOC-2-like LRR domain-containing protein n=1 Tax=Brachypodium distachyon TaxID=15368 RepID=A0A2K2CMD8_BRADI|nr:hypothetical protein BRADI_4g12809v3 [Brachypodium distachyon]PNT63188.1 hypothetical protein BRADI_4g12809v3 [Brachypodium distachyon]